MSPFASAIYGWTSPRDPIVKKVKCRDVFGLNVKNVEEVDSNMIGGTDLSIASGSSSMTVSATDVRGPNSSKMSASRSPAV